MTFRSYVLGMAVALSTAGFVGSAVAGDLPDPPVKAPAIAAVPFFSVDDNRLTYAYQPTATDPGVRGTTAKQVYAFTHFDAWAYGTNFINLSLMKSDHNDPAEPCPANGATGCAGATEFYGIIRSTFGFNQIFNTKAFTWGPLRNVSLEVGANGRLPRCDQVLRPARPRLVAHAAQRRIRPEPAHEFRQLAQRAFRRHGRAAVAAETARAPVPVGNRQQ